MTDHTGYIPPIRTMGSNSIEARVKALEVAQGYDAREQADIWHELDSVHRQIGETKRELEAIQHKAAVWAISALLSAVAALAMIVVKIKAPWLLQ